MGVVGFGFLDVFQQVEQEIARVARQKYLAGDFGRLSLSDGAQEPDAATEALLKYQEEASSYKRPVLKIMALTKGGVRL